VELADPAPAPDYSEDGVDLTVIRWMLSLTPAERLNFLEERTSDILALRALNAGTQNFDVTRAASSSQQSLDVIGLQRKLARRFAGSI